MKATENQIDACNTLKMCMTFWQDSNDIMWSSIEDYAKTRYSVKK